MRCAIREVRRRRVLKEPSERSFPDEKWIALLEFPYFDSFGVRLGPALTR